MLNKQGGIISGLSFRRLRNSILGLILLSAYFIVLFPAVTVKAAGASLFISPAQSSVQTDSTFDLSIMLNTSDQSVNAVLLDLTFPPNLIQVVGPTQDPSIISIWTAQPNFSNTDGRIHLEGGLPSPGFKGSAGRVFGLKFRTKQAGKATISILDTARVLANDGEGTNILQSKNGAVVTITAKPSDGPKITSLTHPDSNAWYKSRNAQFSWTGDNATDISWIIDQNPDTDPDTNPETLNNPITAEATADGNWYFHLRYKASGVWSASSHYLFRVDTTPPAQFTPSIEPTQITANQRPVATFTTTDASSGIDHYEIKTEGLDSNEPTGLFTEQQSPYILPEMQPGKYHLLIKAYDRAGNETIGQQSFTIVGFPAKASADNFLGLLKKYTGGNAVILPTILITSGVIVIIILSTLCIILLRLLKARKLASAVVLAAASGVQQVNTSPQTQAASTAIPPAQSSPAVPNNTNFPQVGQQ